MKVEDWFMDFARQHMARFPAENWQALLSVEGKLQLDWKDWYEAFVRGRVTLDAATEASKSLVGKAVARKSHLSTVLELASRYMRGIAISEAEQERKRREQVDLVRHRWAIELFDSLSEHERQQFISVGLEQFPSFGRQGAQFCRLLAVTWIAEAIGRRPNFRPRVEEYRASFESPEKPKQEAMAFKD
jgi:hypothetical protein